MHAAWKQIWPKRISPDDPLYDTTSPTCTAREFTCTAFDVVIGYPTRMAPGLYARRKNAHVEHS